MPRDTPPAATYLTSRIRLGMKFGLETVSYTHLTLPTIYSV